MRKNLIFGMFAAAGVLLAASCSQENLISQTWEGDEAVVSFTIDLENGVQTRAISDGTGVDKLIYAIFDGTGARITKVAKDSIETSFPATVSIALGVYQDYQVVFWAQNKECGAYKLDDDMNVTVDYTDAANNDDTRDAFYGTTGVFSISGSGSKTVTLTRPFAQVNVGVTQSDWSRAQDLNLDIQSSEVTITNAGTKINLLTGAVSEAKAVTFNDASIPAKATDEEVLTVNGIEYKWLSMSYILVADDSADGTTKTTLESLAYTFAPENGNTITFSNGLTSVPVQRNYRTNIIGQILTGNLDVSITLDQDFNEGDIVYPDTSKEKLIMAAAYGGTVVLEEDVVLDEPLVVAEGVTLVIDLNSYSITYAEAGTTAAWTLTKADTGTNLIQVNGGLEINGNGTVGSSSGVSDISVAATGTLAITGGTYYGTISCETGGSVSITGGIFYVDPTAVIDATAYAVTEVTIDSTTCYMVAAQGVSVVDDATSLTEAISDNAGSIAIACDITSESTLSFTSDAEIDLNGNAITSTKIYVDGGATLTVTDGDINSHFNVDDEGALTLDGVNLTTTTSSNMSIVVGSSSGSGGEGTLTITNSYISSSLIGIQIYGGNNEVTISDTVIEHNYFGITQNGTNMPGSTLTLNNVTISGAYHGVYMSNNANGYPSTLIVNGGSITSGRSAIEVKKTNLTVNGATLTSTSTEQTYGFYGGGAASNGYGIVLAGYVSGQSYDEGDSDLTLSLSNITYNLAAKGVVDNFFNAGKYNGTLYADDPDCLNSLTALDDDGSVSE